MFGIIFHVLVNENHIRIMKFLNKNTPHVIPRIQKEGVKWPPYTHRRVNRKTRNISCSLFGVNYDFPVVQQARVAVT
jgi:hypothetical protein